MVTKTYIRFGTLHRYLEARRPPTHLMLRGLLQLLLLIECHILSLNRQTIIPMRILTGRRLAMIHFIFDFLKNIYYIEAKYLMKS